MTDRAKRKLGTLKFRLGYVEVETDSKGPLLVRVKPMLETTHWRRTDGQTGPPDNWEFEQVQPQHQRSTTEEQQMSEPQTAPQPEPIAQFFTYAHLPAHLQEVSKPFGEMAERILSTLPRNAERTVALRKLLESKDAAVRALLAK